MKKKVRLKKAQPEYEVTIEEVLKRKVRVKAESLEEAIDKVASGYNDESYVLTADDFDGVNFVAEKVK